MQSLDHETPCFGVTRELLCAPETQMLHKGKTANADVFKVITSQGVFVVKDFKKCPWWIRETYGRIMATREYKMMKTIEDIPGVPNKLFKLDGYAMGMAFLDSQTFSYYRQQHIKLPVAFFEQLEQLMQAIHARNISHLDSRNSKNVLVLTDGSPALIDFQSGIRMRWLPSFLKRILILADISGVYKHWYYNDPDSLDEPRKEILRKHFKLRQIWVFKGYKWFSKRQPKDIERALFDNTED